MSLPLRWCIWGLAALFFFYEFVMRVSPSVMVDPLMYTFTISAETVGFVSGLYFYIYAPMQIPVGVLMDRFGPHLLLTSAAAIAGLGGLLFGLAPAVGLLAVGRLLLGFGSAFAFVGLLYITSHNFPKKRVALLIGFANSFAMLGAASGEGPLSLLEGVLGWRWTSIFLGIVGFAISALIFITSRSQRGTKEGHSTKEAFSSLRGVWSRGQTWLNAFIAFSLYATTSGFAALWGVPFLQETHGLSRSTAGFATSMIYIGWMFGGPLIGHFSDRVGMRRPFLTYSALLGGLALLPVLYWQGLPAPLLVTLLFFVGFFSAAELLCFSLAIASHSEKATGSALAFVNFLVMLGGALFQPLVGILLDTFWSGTLSDGIKVYSTHTYQIAMTCFPLTFLLAFILSRFLKEHAR